MKVTNWSSSNCYFVHVFNWKYERIWWRYRQSTLSVFILICFQNKEYTQFGCFSQHSLREYITWLSIHINVYFNKIGSKCRIACVGRISIFTVFLQVPFMDFVIHFYSLICTVFFMEFEIHFYNLICTANLWLSQLIPLSIMYYYYKPAEYD